jgi:hypothetical protein
MSEEQERAIKILQKAIDEIKRGAGVTYLRRDISYDAHHIKDNVTVEVTYFGNKNEDRS